MPERRRESHVDARPERAGIADRSGEPLVRGASTVDWLTSTSAPPDDEQLRVGCSLSLPPCCKANTSRRSTTRPLLERSGSHAETAEFDEAQKSCAVLPHARRAYAPGPHARREARNRGLRNARGAGVRVRPAPHDSFCDREQSVLAHALTGSARPDSSALAPALATEGSSRPEPPDCRRGGGGGGGGCTLA
jgi:hypothetical protein